jgi:hypothetical protein
MKTKYVSTKPLGGKRDSAGIGYIIIPQDKDRDDYIQACLRTGTLSIVLENGGVVDQVLITKSAINELDFPISNDKLGSLVVWINQPKKLQPIVIGTLSKNNEFINFNKESSVLRRVGKDFMGEVSVDANKGVIIINATSSKEDGGDIYIISRNKNEDPEKKSNVNIQVSGRVNIESTNFNLTNSKKLSLVIKDPDIDDLVTSIIYEKGVGFSYKDEFNNEFILNDENIQLKPNKHLNIGDGSEPMMLGETFKTIFEDFTDALSKMATYCAAIQVGTAMGPSTVPTNAAQFTQIASDLSALKEQYKNFQSKQSSLD